MLLQEFAEGRNNNAREMRTAMRPLLEKYIRYRFPNQILDGKWLGDINQFTAPFHHDPNAAFVDDEVRTYAQRTISIVGGC